MTQENIIISERVQEGFGDIRYYEVQGTKWINRCTLLEHRKMQRGDIFNTYRREYIEDSKGKIVKWICDIKYGCVFDGHSLESSLLSLDKYIDENDFMRRKVIPSSKGDVCTYLQPLET